MKSETLYFQRYKLYRLPRFVKRPVQSCSKAQTNSHGGKWGSGCLMYTQKSTNLFHQVWIDVPCIVGSYYNWWPNTCTMWLWIKSHTIFPSKFPNTGAATRKCEKLSQAIINLLKPSPLTFGEQIWTSSIDQHTNLLRSKYGDFGKLCLKVRQGIYAEQLLQFLTTNEIIWSKLRISNRSLIWFPNLFPFIHM